MPKKTLTSEQIVAKLRQIEVLVSKEKAVPLACKEAGIGEYYAARTKPLARRTLRVAVVGPSVGI